MASVAWPDKTFALLRAELDLELVLVVGEQINLSCSAVQGSRSLLLYDAAKLSLVRTPVTFCSATRWFRFERKLQVAKRVDLKQSILG